MGNLPERLRLSQIARGELPRAPDYQRGSLRRPPPPLPPRPYPPPPPPERGVCGRASLTVRRRPPNVRSCSCETAAWAASSVAISTNANPRARPVSRSRTTFTDSTAPASAKSSCRSFSFVSNGILPTYNLRLMTLTPASCGCDHGGRISEKTRPERESLG